MSRPRKINPEATLQSIRGASSITGLSQASIREGCRKGTIPHMMVGNDYRVNMPLFLAQIDEMSRQKA